MTAGKRIRLGGGRFTQRSSVDPLQGLVRQAWQSIAHANVRATTASQVSEDAQEGPSPVEGLMDLQWMAERTVLTLGAGAVGCRNALALAQYGITQILVDHDAVEPRNTVADRTVYNEDDIGKLKVLALRDKILAANPQAKVVVHPRNVHQIGRAELRNWARQSDAALGAIDEGSAMLYLNEVLYPELVVFYQGVHQQGRSGQIIITRPGSPCLKCCMGVENGSEIQTLHREPALGIHVAAVAQLAAQLLIQELAARGGSPLGSPVQPDVSVLFLSHMASELTPHGPGLVLFRVERDPACEVCGNNTEGR